MEIEIEAVTFGDLLAKFQENGLILKLVSASPDDLTNFTLVARPDPKRSVSVEQTEKLSSSES